MNRIAVLAAACAVAIVSAQAYAQPQIPQLAAQAPVKISRNADGIFIGPDPTRAFDRFSQLSDRDLQRYLGISEEVGQLFQKLSVDSIARWREAVEMQRRGEVPQGTAEAAMQQYHEDAEALMEEALTPAQNRKLTQWIYRMESKRIGLGDALVTGRLGLATGVHENQKSRLSRRAAEIEEAMQKRISEIRAAAEAELLAELAPEQRDKAQELLGQDFDHSELTREQKIYNELRRKLEEAPDTFLPIARSAKQNAVARTK